MEPGAGTTGPDAPPEPVPEEDVPGLWLPADGFRERPHPTSSAENTAGAAMPTIHSMLELALAHRVSGGISFTIQLIAMCQSDPRCLLRGSIGGGAGNTRLKTEFVFYTQGLHRRLRAVRIGM
jgi:hypothetical protein